MLLVDFSSHNRFAGSAGCIKVCIFLLTGALIIHDPLPDLSAGVNICASVFFSTWYVVLVPRKKNLSLS